MSASSKKKLRNAQEAEKLTERQLAEKKEAKKIKIYTTAFVVAVAIMLVVAVTIGVMQIIDGSGIRQKNSVALTVGDREVSALEMNYFYVDAVQNFCSSNSDYLMYLLNTYVPLNEQVYSEIENTTWADYFLELAQSNAEYAYSLCAAAEAEGHTLSEAERAELDASVSMLSLYADMYQYPDVETYLKAVYGSFANEKDFLAYQETITLANSYRNAYAAKLEISEGAVAAELAENADAYASFSFNSYYLSATRFLEGGTEDENGTLTYTDEENAAAVAAAEAAAKALCEAPIDSIEAFDEAIAALPINAEMVTAKSSPNTAIRYATLSDTFKQWLVQDHEEGDIGYVASETTAADGTTTIGGYYVFYFIEREDNDFRLPSVRHILVGSETVLNGGGTYTEEELAQYRAEAEQLLAEWEAGEATEESFAALASSRSKDSGSLATGGLYQDILPGQMVEAFNDWCFDERQIGETDIVETSYGFHVMYFSGLSEDTYRERMATETLTTAAMESWFEDITAKYPSVAGDSTYLPMDMVISG